MAKRPWRKLGLGEGEGQLSSGSASASGFLSIGFSSPLKLSPLCSIQRADLGKMVGQWLRKKVECGGLGTGR